MKIPQIINDGLSFDAEEIMKSLAIENAFLTKLVDTIPAKMYFDCEIQEKITADKHLSMDKAVEALKRKSNNFELSAKNKHKRSRLDPFSQKNISQIHDELNKKKKKRKKMKKDNHNPSASLTRAANIEELQRRLHERIELLQAKRKAAQHDPDAQRKQKNKLKKLKHKGNLLKAQAEKVKVEKVKPEKSKNDKSNEKPSFNKEGNLLYGKFDFSEEGQGESKKSEYAGKKTKALLKRAEKKKEKLEKLKEADPQKAEFVAEKEKWIKAIQKTEGMKVRDDPKLLKKSLKREQKKKKKSNKEWKQRSDEVEKKQKVRQEKRNQNIQQKKKEKRDRKLKLLKKKGRVIPKS